MTYTVFISHVEEDQALAFSLVKRLQAAGYTTWCYEHDTIPGPPYLEQVLEAVQRCDAFVLLISRDSLGSSQVTGEVIEAHEKGKSFVPLLIGVSHAEFKKRQPQWGFALKAASSIPVPPEGLHAIMPRILEGLTKLAEVTGDRGAPVIAAPRAAPAGPRVARAARRPIERPIAAYQGDEPYVFVSYAHADMAEVFEELAHVHHQGYRMWYDEGVDPAERFGAKIAGKIQGCAQFIVFLSANAGRSAWVSQEINYAVQAEKPRLFVYLEEPPEPTHMSKQERQFWDTVGFLQAGRDALYRSHLPKAQYLSRLSKSLSPAAKAT